MKNKSRIQLFFAVGGLCVLLSLSFFVFGTSHRSNLLVGLGLVLFLIAFLPFAVAWYLSPQGPKGKN